MSMSKKTKDFYKMKAGISKPIIILQLYSNILNHFFKKNEKEITSFQDGGV